MSNTNPYEENIQSVKDGVSTWPAITRAEDGSHDWRMWKFTVTTDAEGEKVTTCHCANPEKQAREFALTCAGFFTYEKTQITSIKIELIIEQPKVFNPADAWLTHPEYFA